MDFELGVSEVLLTFIVNQSSFWCEVRVFVNVGCREKAGTASTCCRSTDLLFTVRWMLLVNI